MLEIEKRGFLTEAEYNNLLDFLEKNGQNLGADDKDVIYYIYPDKLLKLVNNISRGNAKISLKTSKIGEGSVFPETEVLFAKDDFDKLKIILDRIVQPEKVMEGIQKRRNFKYKDCELAVKWSKEWGFHFELELVVDSEAHVQVAENKLNEIAKELNIKIMTEQELKDFTKKSRKKCNKKTLDILCFKKKNQSIKIMI